MDSQFLRNCLYEYFSDKEFTRKILNVSGILSIVLAGLQLLSSIFNPLSWLSFGGATNMLMIIALIFAFSASNFKMIFIAIIIKLLSTLFNFFKLFNGYYYGFSKVTSIIGYILIIVIYSYILYASIKKLQNTGEWQAGLNDIKTHFNQSVNNIQNNINGVNNQYQQNQQYQQKQQNSQSSNIYADANYVNQGNGLVYKPISTLGYVGYMFLFGIPIIGFILLIVFALSAGNQNLKNFARSYFCLIIIAIILFIAIFVASGGFFLSRLY